MLKRLAKGVLSIYVGGMIGTLGLRSADRAGMPSSDHALTEEGIYQSIPSVLRVTRIEQKAKQKNPTPTAPSESQTIPRKKR